MWLRGCAMELPISCRSSACRNFSSPLLLQQHLAELKHLHADGLLVATYQVSDLWHSLESGEPKDFLPTPTEGFAGLFKT